MTRLEVQRWYESVQHALQCDDTEAALSLAAAFPTPGYRLRLLTGLCTRLKQTEHCRRALEQAQACLADLEHSGARDHALARLARAGLSAGFFEEAYRYCQQIEDGALRGSVFECIVRALVHHKRLPEAQGLVRHWLAAESLGLQSHLRLLLLAHDDEAALALLRSQTLDQRSISAYCQLARRRQSVALLDEARQIITVIWQDHYREYAFAQLAPAYTQLRQGQTAHVLLAQMRTNRDYLRVGLHCISLLLNQGELSLAWRIFRQLESRAYTHYESSRLLARFARQQAQRGRRPWAKAALTLALSLAPPYERRWLLQLREALLAERIKSP